MYIKTVFCAAVCLSLSALVIEVQPQRRQQTKNSNSYAGPNGHVLIVIRSAQFMMGSPLTEPGRSQEEVQHRVRVPRTYAIATTEVTKEQFGRFLAAVPDYGSRWNDATEARFGNPPRFNAFSRTSDSPQVAVSWYDAARYCNWLSALAGIPKSEWVYPEEIDSTKGIELPANYLHRTGYRLPTEAEWEFAARAGRNTAWHFGDDAKLLGRYAWYDRNTNRERMSPVAQLLPNQLGLFDMLGNVWEWTFDRRQQYPSDEAVTEDVEDSVLKVSNGVARTRRGGSFAYEWFTTRSAHRGDTTYFPHQTRDNVGFRVARTIQNH
jgi:formylglycine-generating enzyme required for sulfatase activity